MIAHLEGILREKQMPYLVVDVQGIGYECMASDHTFAHCPEVGQPIQLFTQLIIREDAHALYAFIDREERFLFRHLLKVSGIGPKLAISILSSADVRTLVKQILDQNVSALTKLPGVGKKTAERLVMEMRDKLAKSWHISPAANADLPPALGVAPSTKHSPHQEAVEGLIALGYKPQIASQLIQQAIHTLNQADCTTEQLIRHVLQGMQHA